MDEQSKIECILNVLLLCDHKGLKETGSIDFTSLEVLLPHPFLCALNGSVFQRESYVHFFPLHTPMALLNCYELTHQYLTHPNSHTTP